MGFGGTGTCGTKDERLSRLLVETVTEHIARCV